MVLYSTRRQANLPRYFGQVFDICKQMQHGQLDFVLPDGRRFRATGKQPGHHAALLVHDPDIFARLIREGDLGFCEAYVDGGWSSPDLMAFHDLLHQDNQAVYDGFPGQAVLRCYERLRHALRSNSKSQARKNIHHHYDLGNAFYELWLDRSMTYSSALFKRKNDSLETAQRRKYASIVDQMGVQPGDHILEIGCGWGGFAEYAVKERGLRVTALTISQEQFNFAMERFEKNNLLGAVEVKMRDYRDETGLYDGVASIEMFEAVGQKYWPVYFQSVRDRLKPGAKGTFQIITIEDKRWDLYQKGVDFIQKYIFPGGMLVSPMALRREIERAGLNVAQSIEFGESYSRTLRHWHAVFNARWEDVAQMGFDERFRRMWNFYLCSCAGAFHGGNCDVTQITVQKPIQ